MIPSKSPDLNPIIGFDFTSGALIIIHLLWLCLFRFRLELPSVAPLEIMLMNPQTSALSRVRFPFYSVEGLGCHGPNLRKPE